MKISSFCVLHSLGRLPSLAGTAPRQTFNSAIENKCVQTHKNSASRQAILVDMQLKANLYGSAGIDQGALPQNKLRWPTL